VGVMVLRSADLTPHQARETRVLCERAWAAKDGHFDADDWRSALGGMHVLFQDAGAYVAHAAVVERALELDGAPLRTGYVEAVATLPERQHEGLASAVMRTVNALIDERFELGALDTGMPAFYERMGWVVWPGRTGLRTADGVRLTPEEDGHVLLRPGEAPFQAGPGSLLTCDWRPGDLW
jgi:aminoglycoside 2'-N-acetyltransferase I